LHKCITLLKKPFAVALLWLLLISILLSAREPLQTNKDEYKAKDALTGYLEKLYEVTDDEPEYYYNKTDSMLQTLWRQPATVQEQTAYLDFILLHSYHLQKSGQIQASSKWYEFGLNFLRRQKLSDYETEEFIYKPLGNNYVRLGDYDKAIALQETAIAESFAKENNESVASLYGNLAITYFWLQQYDTVQSICNNGLQYVKNNTSVAGLLCNIKADAFFEQYKYDSATFYNERAITFFKQPTSVAAEAEWIVSALTLSAKILAVEKNYAAALLKIDNATKLLQQSYGNSRQRDKAKLYIIKGNLLLQLNKADSSLAMFKKGIDCFSITNQYFPDYTVSELYGGMAQGYGKINTDSGLYYYKLAVENDYYASQLITTSLNSVSTVKANALIQQKAIAAFENKYRETKEQQYLKKLLWIVELGKARTLLNDIQQNQSKQQAQTDIEQEQLMKQLRYDYLLLAEATDAVKKINIQQRIRQQELALRLTENRFSRLLQTPSFELFANKIDSLTATKSLVCYAAMADSLLILTVNANNIVYKKIATPEENINKLLQTYFKDGSTAFVDNPGAYFNETANLYAHLLSEDTKPELVISADAYLHRLPFEALATADKKFLAQQKQLSYVYSLLQYYTPQQNVSRALPVTAYSFEKQYMGFAALPQSAAEINFLKKHFATTDFAAAAISNKELLESWQQPAILHFATHAVANENLQQPYLVLQQKFYLGQLQYTNTAAPLVVLTACETAAGNLQKDEGVISIARAFISKGVKGVVASRWQVDDAVAPQLVTAFYDALGNIHSPAKALHAAQKKYLNTANVVQQNPLLWAGFCYTGVEQVILLQQNNNTHWYWWLLLLLLPIIFLLARRRFA
jgi:CHAT domain-containing protein